MWDPFINGLTLVCTEDYTQFRYVNTQGETIYKWTESASEAPRRQMSPEERSREFILSTEYGPLFLDMERAEKEME